MKTVWIAPKVSKALRKEDSSKSKDTLRTRLMRKESRSIHSSREV